MIKPLFVHFINLVNKIPTYKLGVLKVLKVWTFKHNKINFLYTKSVIPISFKSEVYNIFNNFNLSQINSKRWRWRIGGGGMSKVKICSPINDIGPLRRFSIIFVKCYFFTSILNNILCQDTKFLLHTKIVFLPTINLFK